MVEGTTGEDRPADLRRVMVVAGWVAAGFVGVGTVAGELPDGSGVVVLTLTVVGLGLWLVSLSPRLSDQRLLFGCLVGAGLLGSAIDRLNPHGPAYILSFMAVAGIGLRLGRRPAAVSGVVVIAALAWARRDRRPATPPGQP